ncbi:hypothetical protein BJY04DRAFT_224375 [Aspergillus karnatakaensis]|uniref:uncharacterized protein n=1 Tax=Aspergillus karnatakaensis TaxID=1810916 RepID=UPI003CCCE4CF
MDILKSLDCQISEHSNPVTSGVAENDVQKATPAGATLSCGEEGIQPPSRVSQGPIQPAPARRGSTKRVRRTSTSTRSGGRPRSAIILPSRPQFETVNHVSEPDNAISSDLYAEILQLFALIAEQKASPILPFYHSSLEPTAFDTQLAPKQVGDGSKEDCSNSEEDRTRDPQRGRTADFRSMGWTEQQLLLDRELRRLLIWDEDFWEASRKSLETDRLRAIDASFSSIGTTLIQILRQNPQLEEQVECVDRMLNKPDRAALQRKDDTKTADDDPLENIRIAIDHLFQALHPLKRRRERSRARSLPRFGSPPGSFSIIATPRQGSRSINLDERNVVKDKSLKSPRMIKHVRFKPGGFEDETSEDEEEGPSRKSRFLGKDDIPTSVIPSTDSTHTEGRLVIQISDRPEAFQKAPTLSAPSLTPLVRPRISRVRTHEMPKKIRNFDWEAEIAFLSKNYADLSLSSPASSADITDRILNIAQTEELVPYEPGSEAGARQAHPTSTLSLLFTRLGSTLGLARGLPDWQIFTMPDQHDYAKSAVLLIYFSILREIISCAVSISKDLQSKLLERTEAPPGDGDDIDIFCAYIQQLSEVTDSMDSGSHFFQPQLQGVITRLKTITSGSTQVSTTATNMTSRIEKSDFPKVGVRYHPLAVACYLSPATSNFTDPSSANEIPNDLIPRVARELLGVEGSERNP